MATYSENGCQNDPFYREKGIFSYQRGGYLIAILVDHLGSEPNWWVGGSKFLQTS